MEQRRPLPLPTPRRDNVYDDDLLINYYSPNTFLSYCIDLDSFTVPIYMCLIHVYYFLNTKLTIEIEILEIKYIHIRRNIVC